MPDAAAVLTRLTLRELADKFLAASETRPPANHRGLLRASVNVLRAHADAREFDELQLAGAKDEIAYLTEQLRQQTARVGALEEAIRGARIMGVSQGAFDWLTNALQDAKREEEK